jgi:hypothetical protein
MVEKETEKILEVNPEDLIEMRAEELAEEKTKEVREKAVKWVEEKSNEKAQIMALEMFEKEKELSNEMKTFHDQQTQLNWMFEQKALPE